MEEPLNANDDDHHAVASGKVLCSVSYSLLVIIILSFVGFMLTEQNVYDDPDSAFLVLNLKKQHDIQVIVIENDDI